eukprot:1046264-Pyramimonas_sp.AAC.1
MSTPEGSFLPSVGDGFIFAPNEVSGDAAKPDHASKPAPSLEMPKVIVYACNCKAAGIGWKQQSVVDQVLGQSSL